MHDMCMVVHDSSSVGRSSAFLADRQRRILERLGRDGQVNASGLAEEFSTSEDTIRRDLRDLAARGHCQRVYGGAIAVSPASTSIAVRVAESYERKTALGKAMVALLRPRQFVFIDAGSTNLAFARVLPTDLALTVATHDPAIAGCLVGRPGIELLVVGGSIHPEIGAALGGRPMQEIAAMRPDLLVLGACSIDVEAGLGAFHFDDTQMTSVLVQVAGSVAVAVLNEKLGSVASYRVAGVESIADVVVEADASSAATAALEQKGLRIHRAGPADM